MGQREVPAVHDFSVLSSSPNQSLSVLILHSWPGTGMTQWGEHSSPTTVARVRFNSLRHMWVELAVGSRPFSKGFSKGSQVFLPPQTEPTLQIPRIRSAHLIITSCTLKVFKYKRYKCLSIILFIYLPHTMNYKQNKKR